MREDFISEFVTRYVGTYPPDARGFIHVTMIRLEIEAYAEKLNL